MSAQNAKSKSPSTEVLAWIMEYACHHELFSMIQGTTLDDGCWIVGGWWLDVGAHNKVL